MIYVAVILIKIVCTFPWYYKMMAIMSASPVDIKYLLHIFSIINLYLLMVICALEALYSVSVGDNNYRNLLYTPCYKIQKIRNSSKYIASYSYQDADSKCILFHQKGITIIIYI